MNREMALQSFWESFSIPAYDENSVPSNTELPYITYEMAVSDFNTELPLAASIWYRSTSWAKITQKFDEISAYIGRGGRLVNYEGGAFWLRLRNSMRMGEPSDDMVRRILMNLTIEFID